MNALPHTVADQPAWPASTRPMATAAADDVRDLLPPVSYPPARGQPDGGLAAIDGARPAGAAAGGLGPVWPSRPAMGGTQAAAPGRGAERAGGMGQPPGADPGGGFAARSAPASVSPWSPLVLGCVAVLVALSVLAPVVGTAIALGVLLALRAASVTGRQLAKRRSADGRGASGSLVAIALYPVALVRSLLVLLVLAPVALLGFAVVVAATIIAVPAHPFGQALAYGAGALVAIVGIGPGSRAARGLLAGFFSAIAGSPARLAVAYVGVLAIAAWAGLTAWSQPGAYWPVGNLHLQLVHLPALRTVLTDVRQSLLRLAHRFGL